eukprot:scaffold852_cov197-Alexandrium_tamarense.AAC.30
MGEGRMWGEVIVQELPFFVFRGDRLYHQQRNYETIDKNRTGRANQHHNGATGNMCSYTAIDEIPVVPIYHFFGTNSVTSWDFVFVVSDCGAIENLYHTHHVTSSYEETMIPMGTSYES